MFKIQLLFNKMMYNKLIFYKLYSRNYSSYHVLKNTVFFSFFFGHNIAFWKPYLDKGRFYFIKTQSQKHYIKELLFSCKER